MSSPAGQCTPDARQGSSQCTDTLLERRPSGDSEHTMLFIDSPVGLLQNLG